MPAKTTIFNTRAVATHSFALAPRNTILFSPHGRFVLVAGFGNLAGQMDIYDLTKDYLKICTIEASNASVCEWSPDGKHILTATTSPRLRVDNGVRIWHAGGGLMYNEDLQELYHVCWRPESTIMHPLEDSLHPMPTPHASALAYLGTKKTPSKPAGAYRPPGARGTVTPLAFKREDEGGAAYVSNGSMSLGSGVNGFSKPRRREVPGAEAVGETLLPGAAPGGGVSLAGTADGDENLSKAALKNKKKREAKKAKDAADKAAGLSAEVDGSASADPSAHSRSPERRDRRSHERNRSKGNLEQSDRPPKRREGSRQRRNQSSTHANAGSTFNSDKNYHPSSTPQPLTTTTGAAEATLDLTITSPDSGASPHDKKIRALLKKLRAIDDLKMRRAGGEKLEGTQIKKMDTEDSVRKELDTLGWNE